MPKPRGKKGKYGNIYHNDEAYLTYKRQVETIIIRSVPKGSQWKYPIGVALLSEFLAKNRGSEPDLIDNCIGSVLDALVAKDYIKDDSQRYLRDCLIRGVESDCHFNQFWIFDSGDYPIVLDRMMRVYNEVNDRLTVASFKRKYFL